MRKAALAIAITLLLTLVGTSPALLGHNLPGSSPQSSYPAYAPPATDFIYPVGAPRVAPTYDKGNANGFYISQMFNNSCDPALGQGFYMQGEYFCGHTGVDLADMQEGDPVAAVANGLVVFAGYNSTYGEMVRIQHLLPDGSYVYSQYEHMEYGSLLVVPNQVVTIGQTIGRVGGTGFVTGAHLHFEMKSVNEDGHGYTFGNPAFILGYYEPIQYIAAHTQGLLPTAVATATPPQPSATGQLAQTPPADASTPDASAPVTVTAPTSDTTPLSVTAPASDTSPLSVTAPASGTTGATGTTPVSATAPTSGGGEAQGVLDSFTKSYADYVTVTADQVNVRSGSGYRFAPLNVVAKGARLGYLGLSGDGWVHVALPGAIKGYIARQLVEGARLPKLPPAMLDPTQQTGPVVTVVDARYPARNGPLMRDMALEPLWVGEKLPYLGPAAGSPSWDRVALASGRVGYILNWYLKGPSVDVGQAIGGGSPIAATDARGARSGASRVKPRVVAAPTTAPAAPAARSHFMLTAPFVMTTMDNVNLRVGPRLGAARIEMMSVGTKLHLRGYHVSWAAVTAPDGANGYVLAQLISPAAVTHPTARPATHSASATRPARARHGARVATPAPRRHTSSVTSTTQVKVATSHKPRATATMARYAVVAVVAANVHTAPNRKAPVVISALKGARLAVRGATGDWILVEASKSLSGWMMRDLTHG